MGNNSANYIIVKGSNSAKGNNSATIVKGNNSTKCTIVRGIFQLMRIIQLSVP